MWHYTRVLTLVFILLIIHDKLFFPLNLSGLTLLFFFFFYRVGIDLPSIEVRYEHLNIEADAYIGSRALPTFTNFMTNFLEVKI